MTQYVVANSRPGFFARLFRRGPVAEMIGQTRRRFTAFFDRARYGSTQDQSEPNYAWYDKARRGLADGLEIAGLLLKPINSKVANWVVGERPQFALDNPDAAAALNQWMEAHWADVVEAMEESVSLGNMYLLVNPDLSVSIISPDVVTPIVENTDYSNIIGWRVSQNFAHPSEPGQFMQVVDEFYPDRRVRTVSINGQAQEQETFPNLLGRLPILHIPNNRSANETFGRPELEALVTSRKGVLHRYGDILDAAILGNIRQGRPIRVFNFDTPQALKAFEDTYGTTSTTTTTNDEGVEVTTEDTSISVNTDEGVLLAGGSVTFSQPGSFAKDTETLLAILFYLIVQHTEIPEFALGVSMDSSKASAETQLPPFIKWIEKRRRQANTWLIELAEIVLAYQQVLGQAASSEGLAIKWAKLTEDDRTLTLEVIKWAHMEGLITSETALELAPNIEIEDVEGEVEKARAAIDAVDDAAHEVDFDQELEDAAARVEVAA